MWSLNPWIKASRGSASILNVQMDVKCGQTFLLSFVNMGFNIINNQCYSHIQSCEEKEDSKQSCENLSTHFGLFFFFAVTGNELIFDFMTSQSFCLTKYSRVWCEVMFLTAKDWAMQQENDPKLSSNSTTERVKKKRIGALQTAQSKFRADWNAAANP